MISIFEEKKQRVYQSLNSFHDINKINDLSIWLSLTQIYHIEVDYPTQWLELHRLDIIYDLVLMEPEWNTKLQFITPKTCLSENNVFVN